MPAFGPLVAPDWLRQHSDDPDLVVVDFRWYLDGRSGREAYLSGHIPGAVFLDLDDVTGPHPPGGRHPLPSRERFQAAARAAGIGKATTVVAYDDASGSNAGRLWWLLRWFGHRRAAVLDGGIQAWGEPLETHEVAKPEGDFEAQEPDPGAVVDFEQVAGRPAETVLIDARAPERYRGEEEPVDPRAGHIPGAVNVFWKSNVGEDGRFRSAAELRRLYQAAGVRNGAEVVVYCGSGVSSVHDLIALELAGFKGVKLYAGSWSEWLEHGEAAVGTGPEP